MNQNQPPTYKQVILYKNKNEMLYIITFILMGLSGIITPLILYNTTVNEFYKNNIELKCNIKDWRHIKFQNDNKYYVMDYYYNLDNYTVLQTSKVYYMGNFQPDTSINQTCYVKDNTLRFTYPQFEEYICYILLIFFSSIIVVVLLIRCIALSSQFF